LGYSKVLKALTLCLLRFSFVLSKYPKYPIESKYEKSRFIQFPKKNHQSNHPLKTPFLIIHYLKNQQRLNGKTKKINPAVMRDFFCASIYTKKPGAIVHALQN
jgi:hypothetical protein